MAKVSIMQDEDKDWARVYTPYDASFVQLLKDNVDRSQRRAVYREENGKNRFLYWAVHKAALSDVIALLHDCYMGEEIVSDLAENADWVEALFSAVPDTYVNVVARALSQAFHPDHGGDGNIMRRINEQWQKRKA